jgi:hypothetical protein
MSEANKELVRRHFEEIFYRKSLAVCVIRSWHRISWSMRLRPLHSRLPEG